MNKYNSKLADDSILDQSDDLENQSQNKKKSSSEITSLWNCKELFTCKFNYHENF